MRNEDIYQQFMSRAIELKAPINATFEITLQCPLRCRHCYNFDRQSVKKTQSQLSKEQVLNAIGQLAEVGTLNLNFTGGEPLLNPHLVDYVREARRLHFVVGLKTNAMLFTEEKILELKKAGLNEIQISLYGSTDETYEKFTDFKQGFSRVEFAVRNLIKHQFKPMINIILHRQNVHELSSMLNYCENLNLTSNISLEITDRQDLTSTNDYVLTAAQYKELMTGPHRELFLGTNEDGGLQCPCAVTNCAIAVNGDVLPCVGAPIKAGSILEQSFAEIWKNSMVFNSIRKIKNEDFKDCFTCADKNFCQRSSGSAFLNTGDYMGKDPRTCEVTRIRREVLTHQTQEV